MEGAEKVKQILLSLVMMLLIVVPSQALQSRDDYKSLKGISGVFVVIGDITDDVANKGINKDNINSLVELRLRSSGIRVLSEKEYYKDSVGAMLCVSLNVIKGSQTYAASVDLKLRQIVSTVNQSQELIAATTWDRGFVSLYGNDSVQRIKNVVDDLMTQFCNDFLKANPKS